MTDCVSKIKAKELGLVVLIWFFAFQRALTLVSPVFGYVDEVFAIYAGVVFLINCIKCSNSRKENLFILCLMVILFVEGIVSNILSGVLNNWFAICVDVISIFKVILAFLWARSVECDTKKIIDISAKIAHVIVIIMFSCWVVSRFVDIGMWGNVRYGIASYKFVFGHPGNFSKFFYFLIPLLAADMINGTSIKKVVMFILASICWLATLRSRAFSFVALFWVFWLLYYGVKKRREVRIKWYYIVVIFAVALYFSWDQVIYYFTNAREARALLLKYSVITMNDYAPLGTGFGTYGSDIAIKYYSTLYTKYGFDRIYGMGLKNTSYMNDNYWPMIFAQFGYVGTVIMGILMYKLHKIILSTTRKQKHYFFAATCACAFLLLSSVASKSYSEYSSICVFALLGLLVRDSESMSYDS